MKSIYIDSQKRTVNDTGKYALQINYVFGLFDTLAPERQHVQHIFEHVFESWSRRR